MEVPLTQGKVAVIDDVDADIIAPYKWWAVKSRSADRWYAATKIGGRRIWMHALLTTYPMTDHRDCDGLNNRRGNLRSCTNAQNCQNRRKGSRASSQFKGVYWNRATETWRACVRKSKKLHYLGTFYTEEAAAEAYRAKATELFGEFARF